MREQGWHVDPYGLHGERWYSDGTPTSLVRDGGIESRDAPPPGELPASLVALNPTPGDASDTMRADEGWVSFFADEPPTTSVPGGFMAAGYSFVAGVGLLIASFFLPAGHLRIRAVLWLVGGAWSAVSAVVVRRRQRGAGEAAAPPPGRS